MRRQGFILPGLAAGVAGMVGDPAALRANPGVFDVPPLLMPNRIGPGRRNLVKMHERWAREEARWTPAAGRARAVVERRRANWR